MAGESGAIIAVALFVLSISCGLFMMNMSGMRYALKDWLNFLFRRIVWILLVCSLWLNTSMMMSLADFASLGINGRFVFYLFLFGRIGFVLMFYIAFRTAITTLSMWRIERKKQRMGDDGEN